MHKCLHLKGAPPKANHYSINMKETKILVRWKSDVELAYLFPSTGASRVGAGQNREPGYKARGRQSFSSSRVTCEERASTITLSLERRSTRLCEKQAPCFELGIFQKLRTCSHTLCKRWESSTKPVQEFTRPNLSRRESARKIRRLANYVCSCVYLRSVRTLAWHC